jgi:DNA polymerase-3 subunit alpha
LYISAHPLDNYDKYFEEQTIPLSHVTPDIDGKPATVGGIITTVRTIVTKSGSKMAFVGIEDKMGEGEIIIFPKLYEQYGAKLVQDAVVKAIGKISARGRDGNVGTEAKIIADELQFVSDQELMDYESTGRKMDKPKGSVKSKTKQYSKPTPTKAASVTQKVVSVPVEDNSHKKLFVQVKNPEDHESLISLKKICSDHPGMNDIILVFGTEKKSAVKLPFRIDSSPELVEKLIKILGESSVVLK